MRLIFILLVSYSVFSLELKDLPMLERVSQLKTKTHFFQINENEYVTHFKKDSPAKFVHQGAILFDFTLPIENPDMIESSRENKCSGLTSYQEVINSNDSCKTWFDSLMKLYSVNFIVMRDYDFTSLPYKDHCINTNHYLKFHNLRSKDLSRTIPSDLAFRCKFKNAEELFLIDYFNLDFDFIKKRNNKIQEKYIQANKDPHKVYDLVARRFIDRKDWEFALRMKTPIQEVYSPKPTTWNNWANTTFNLVHKAASENRDLSINDLIAWNHASLEDIFVFMRNGAPVIEDEVEKYLRTSVFHQAITRFFSSSSALQDHELSAILNFKFLAPDGVKPDMYWEKGYCQDISDEEQEKRNLNCGILSFPHSSVVKATVNHLISLINHFLNTNKSDEATYMFAVMMQKQFVALHPFADGNGRTSRWVMDYIMLKAGLPLIIHHNMNYDLTTNEISFLSQAKRGSLFGVLTLEQCLASGNFRCKFWEN